MKRNKMAGAVLAAVMAASLLISGCGADIDPSATVATIGETKISYGLANFWLRMQQSNYDGYYRQFFGADMWEKDQDGSGKTMGDTVKQSVMDGFKQFYVLDAHKSDYNIEITTEEMEKIKAVANAFMTKNASVVSKGYAVTREEDVAEALRLLTVESRVSAAIKSGVDKNVSNEEAAQRTFTYARFDIKTKAGDNGSTVELTEEEKETVRKNVDKVLEDAKAGGKLEDLAKAQGGIVNPYSYGKDEDGSNIPKEVTSAADKLKEGEYADVIKTEDHLYIIRLDKEFDEEATESKKKSIITQRENELFNSVTKPWLDAVELKVDEGLWSKVGFDRVMSVAVSSSSAQ